MKKKILLFLFFLIPILIIILLLINKGYSYTKFELKEYSYNNQKIKIYRNKYFNDYNTGKRDRKIEYIVVHYTGVNDDVVDIIDQYTLKKKKDSSADYFVNHDGTIYQYNTNITNRYCWAVGGKILSGSQGGILNGIVTNQNSISIEMATKNDDGDWTFNEETLLSSIDLIKYLMYEYDIDVEHVVRHYDVTGKYCPGVIGWYGDSGSSIKWESFKENLID